jgi:hypothetical protein
MSTIADHRAVEGRGGGLCVMDSQHRNQPTDGKGKGRPPARLMWLGRLMILLTPPILPTGALFDFSNKLNAPSAVGLRHTAISAHDDAR